MPKKKSKRKNKLGMAPGSLIFTGEQKMNQSNFSITRFNTELFEEKFYDTVEDMLADIQPFEGVIWVNIDGIHDIETIDKIGNFFGLHKLTLEDILSVGQRAKIDEYDEYLYVVLRMFNFVKEEDVVDDEQVSFVMKGNMLISLQEREGDVFNHVRNRIRDGKGNVVKKNSDYLLYALLDSIIDYYFLILENLGEKIDAQEDILFKNSNDSDLRKLYDLKREILHLRRSIYPIREMVNGLDKLDEKKISPENKIFIRDLYDHTIQIIENIEVLRDMISSITDLHMNNLSYKMNNVMKVLTIIATIFIPLTFIVGIYGMNFENMPELSWKYGYFGVMFFMFLIALSMIYYFRNKRWL
jgi:magnesium transporter